MVSYRGKINILHLAGYLWSPTEERKIYYSWQDTYGLLQRKDKYITSSRIPMVSYRGKINILHLAGYLWYGPRGGCGGCPVKTLNFGFAMETQ